MPRKLKIRMYNVGFGDCFLVTIPSGSKKKKILFDCGSIKAGASDIDAVAEQVIADVTEAKKPRIDVVVATHRHKDHVSGFANPRWDEVEVGEVWMPWTEDPHDPEARRIRNAQAGLATTLAQSAARTTNSIPTDSGATARKATVSELAENALSNEKAMDTLHSGFRGQPRRRFLPTKEKGDLTFSTDVLPGVTISVLGPSRNEEVIKEMDPPAGQSYLQLMEALEVSPDRAPDPFREDWWMEVDDPIVGHLLPTQADRAQISLVGSDLDSAVAVALDKAVNGTSLMLVLQIGKACLLFPGDAQWGTWEQALKNSDWLTLMSRISFYKIGHHGSHNATPVQFVESAVGRDFWAMVSTKAVSQWPNIPRPQLLKALATRTKKIARSDQPRAIPNGFTAQGDIYIETEVPF